MKNQNARAAADLLLIISGAMLLGCQTSVWIGVAVGFIALGLMRYPDQQ